MHILEEFDLPAIFKIELYGFDISINKAVLTMWLAAFIIFMLLFITSRKAKIVPKGVQNIMEVFIEFVKDDIVLTMMGKEGLTWLPFLTTVFFFVLFMNILGIIPGLYTATSRLLITATMAISIFFIVHITGVRKHGLGYINNFVPSGIPVVIVPFLFIIEIISSLAKPFSLAVRLFANMFAGHMILGAFIGLTIMFNSLIIAPLPLLGAVLISGLEIFFSAIQAYVFTMLSAMYISDALSSHH